MQKLSLTGIVTSQCLCSSQDEPRYVSVIHNPKILVTGTKGTFIICPIHNCRTAMGSVPRWHQTAPLAARAAPTWIFDTC